MRANTRLNLALGAFLLSLILLVLGVTAPVITIRGVLMPDGLVDVVVDTMAAKAPPEEQVNFTGVGRQLKKAGIAQFIGAFIPMTESKEVYVQTRSIIGSVANLYRNGAWFAPTLILLFSICVPVSKAALLYSALMHVEGRQRTAILRIVNAIGKWSMADVFVVAIFIAYLAAKATVGTTQAVAFKSEFEIGFYFFAAYCIVAIIGQQLATAAIRADERLPGPSFRLLWQTAIGVVISFAVAVAASIFFKTEIAAAPIRDQLNFPFGITFGLFVLAPLAMRLSCGWLRALAAVLYSHCVYILTASWAVAQHENWYVMGGALPGAVGALLLLLGVRRLLHTRYTVPMFAAALFLCGGFGVAIVGGATLPGSLGFYGGHLAWQAVVAAVIAIGIVYSRTVLGSIDTAAWHYRLSPALPCFVVCVFLDSFSSKPLFSAVGRMLGFP